MTPYAAGTDVSVDRSKAELDRLLQKYGASRFLSGWDEHSIVIGFEMHRRQVKIQIPAPSKNDPEVQFTPSKKFRRSDPEVIKAWQAAVRQRWRALVLVVKAKLEAVSAGVASFETEFLGHLVLPGGATVGELVIPRLDDLPNMLPAAPVKED